MPSCLANTAVALAMYKGSVHSADRQVFCAPSVVVGDGLLSPGTVTVLGGRITDVRRGWPRRRGGAVVLPHGVLAPGLIDLQFNGSFGVDLATADDSEWAYVRSRLPASGVTSILATFVTAPLDDLAAAVQRVGMMQRRMTVGGARVLGAHIEGPFLSPTYRGAHDPRHLRTPSPSAVLKLCEGNRGQLALVTLAPELPGALEAIAMFRSDGVRVSVGHSDATASQVALAADAGATMVTHLYNAQRALNHREPGVVGRALIDQRLTLGLILDLCHVAPDACRLAFKVAAGRVALVTDSVAAAGMPLGRHVMNDGEVVVGGGPPRRPDGTLAGSALRLDDAVRNAVKIGVDPVVAIRAATAVPADLLGRRHLGRIAPGASADLIWLSEDLITLATWVNGDLAFGDVDTDPGELR
jgi:N-acetylglucosamine-6-phosphate deacetylase